MGKVPKVVIVGGGFGGIKAAQLLAKEKVDITLVDRHNFHLFQPLLYQVSTSMLSSDEIAYPIRAFFRRNRNVELFMAKATGVDQQRNVLRELTRGRNNREIGERLCIEESTVRYHLEEIMRKAGIHSRVELAVKASRANIVVSDEDRLNGMGG